jgi:tRNA-specific 2-thiouridylase
MSRPAADTRPERVVVAMSGGVDSSLAAALVAESGCEAIGITMHLEGGASRCCSLADADDARRVAERLGIRFFVANYAERFRAEVKEPFADAYLAGRTPIPCLACNSRFKFRYLLERARALGAQSVASGHYARVDVDPDTGLHRLRRARDRGKDQSYFLYELTQEQLRRVRFPLVPDGDTAGAVERIRPGAAAGSGEVVDGDGRVVGRHRGVHRFTVGQRRGLALAAGRRLYVTSLDAERNRVVVGDVAALRAGGASLEAVHWIAGPAPARPVRASVRVRHRHEGAWATVAPTSDGGATVHFDEPVRAVAPGQAAVFYGGDVVLGGGTIARAVP